MGIYLFGTQPRPKGRSTFGLNCFNETKLLPKFRKLFKAGATHYFDVRFGSVGMTRDSNPGHRETQEGSVCVYGWVNLLRHAAALRAAGAPAAVLGALEHHRCLPYGAFPRAEGTPKTPPTRRDGGVQLCFSPHSGGSGVSNSAPQPPAFGKEAIGTTPPFSYHFRSRRSGEWSIEGQQFSISQKLDSPPKARPTPPSSGGGVRTCWEPPPPSVREGRPRHHTPYLTRAATRYGNGVPGRREPVVCPERNPRKQSGVLRSVWAVLYSFLV